MKASSSFISEVKQCRAWSVFGWVTAGRKSLQLNYDLIKISAMTNKTGLDALSLFSKNQTIHFLFYIFL
jgi:hypothetical protein